VGFLLNPRVRLKPKRGVASSLSQRRLRALEIVPQNTLGAGPRAANPEHRRDGRKSGQHVLLVAGRVSGGRLSQLASRASSPRHARHFHNAAKNQHPPGHRGILCKSGLYQYLRIAARADVAFFIGAIVGLPKNQISCVRTQTVIGKDVATSHAARSMVLACRLRYVASDHVNPEHAHL
jgi:hypothetical protein